MSGNMTRARKSHANRSPRLPGAADNGSKAWIRTGRIARVVAAALVLAGCRGSLGAGSEGQDFASSATGSGRGEAIKNESPGERTMITFTGTVAHKRIEGGFFAIEAEDGAKYVPLDLPEDFAKDGLKVKVTGRPRPDLVSHHMYGTLIEIVDISAL